MAFKHNLPIFDPMTTRPDLDFYTRRITMDDVDTFRDIRLRALKEAPHAFMSTYVSAKARSMRSWEEQVRSSTTGSDRVTVLCFCNALAVGVAAIYREFDHPIRSGEVIQVWVDPKHRNRGIANDLMRFLIDWAEECHYEQLYATIHRDNAEVLPFYKQIGFNLDAEATALAPERDLLIRLPLS